MDIEKLIHKELVRNTLNFGELVSDNLENRNPLLQ
jgi:hypothetical protein